MPVTKTFLQDQITGAEMGFGSDVIERLVTFHRWTVTIRPGVTPSIGYVVDLKPFGHATKYVGMGDTISLAVAEALTVINRTFPKGL